MIEREGTRSCGEDEVGHQRGMWDANTENAFGATLSRKKKLLDSLRDEDSGHEQPDQNEGASGRLLIPHLDI